VVNKMTMYYQHTNPSRNIHLVLEQTIYTGSNYGVNEDLAYINSVNGDHSTAVTLSPSAHIDNRYLSYWAYINIYPTNLILWAVTIEYTPPGGDGGVVAISDAAFTPFYDGYDYQNHGRWLFHQNSNGNGSTDGLYLAPVSLPQGATVDAILFDYYDGSSSLNANGTLARSKLGSYEPMAQAPSSTLSGYASSGQSTIAYNTVDNTQYSYFVFFTLPVTAVHNPPVSGDILGCRAAIYYTYNYYNYLPTVRK
jgi:hypothetical protein